MFIYLELTFIFISLSCSQYVYISYLRSFTWQHSSNFETSKANFSHYLSYYLDWVIIQAPNRFLIELLMGFSHIFNSSAKIYWDIFGVVNWKLHFCEFNRNFMKATKSVKKDLFMMFSLLRLIKAFLVPSLSWLQSNFQEIFCLLITSFLFLFLSFFVKFLFSVSRIFSTWNYFLRGLKILLYLHKLRFFVLLCFVLF